MFLLDENVAASQREALKRWRHFRQVGIDFASPGLDDVEEIIPLLRRLGNVTFVTRDVGFYQRRLCHPTYCLIVIVDRRRERVARFTRRVLQLGRFDTAAKRMGTVISVSSDQVRWWEFKSHDEHVERRRME
jgi:hypothetical protein